MVLTMGRALRNMLALPLCGIFAKKCKVALLQWNLRKRYDRNENDDKDRHRARISFRQQNVGRYFVMHMVAKHK